MTVWDFLYSVSNSRANNKTPSDHHVSHDLIHCVSFSFLLHTPLCYRHKSQSRISKSDLSPVIHCEMHFLVHFFGLISPPEKWLRNCYSPLYFRSLFGKFCICDEDLYVSLMYWSSDGVVTFGLDNRGLDASDPVSVECFKVPWTSNTLGLLSVAVNWLW